MSKISITEAAKLAGVSRQHFYKKYINSGVIAIEQDKNNRSCVDTSELIRVFGQLTGYSQDDSHILQQLTPTLDTDYSALQAEIKAVRSILADKEAQLQEAKEREQWLKQHVTEITGALRLLEHKDAVGKSDNAGSDSPKKAGFWARAFGRQS